jgi:hypothetical protein
MGPSMSLTVSCDGRRSGDTYSFIPLAQRRYSHVVIIPYNWSLERGGYSGRFGRRLTIIKFDPGGDAEV